MCVCYDRLSSDVVLRYVQHARDINIHKLHPLPEKWAWALPTFYTVEPVTVK